MILLYILFIVYILAINFYSFLLLKAQKEESETTDRIQKAGDGRLFLAGFLGGAITIYVCMFIMKYRTKNLFLMIVMPVLAALNVYLWIVAFRAVFPFFAV